MFLLFKYALRSLLYSIAAAAIMAYFNFGRHLSLGLFPTSGRVSFAVFAGIAMFLVMILIFPVLVWIEKAKRPKEEVTLARIDKRQLQVLHALSLWTKKHTFWILGLIFALALGVSVLDSF